MAGWYGLKDLVNKEDFDRLPAIVIPGLDDCL